MPWPRAPERCPHCQLVIGPQRARSEATFEPGARGVAAGVISSDAKRAVVPGDVEPERVKEAIRQVAAELGRRTATLLMIDYQQRASMDERLPSVSHALTAFGSWKEARWRAAHGEAGQR